MLQLKLHTWTPKRIIITDHFKLENFPDGIYTTTIAKTNPELTLKLIKFISRKYNIPIIFRVKDEDTLAYVAGNLKIEAYPTDEDYTIGDEDLIMYVRWSKEGTTMYMIRVSKWKP